MCGKSEETVSFGFLLRLPHSATEVGRFNKTVGEQQMKPGKNFVKKIRRPVGTFHL